MDRRLGDADAFLKRVDAVEAQLQELLRGVGEPAAAPTAPSAGAATSLPKPAPGDDFKAFSQGQRFNVADVAAAADEERRADRKKWWRSALANHGVYWLTGEADMTAFDPLDVETAAGAGDGSAAAGGSGSSSGIVVVKAARSGPSSIAGTTDYGKWERWVQDPDDPATRADAEAEAAERERKRDEAFEAANPGFVEQFKREKEERRAQNMRKALEADKSKDAGNSAFKRGNFYAALGYYADGLSAAPGSVPLLNNTAACHLHLSGLPHKVESLPTTGTSSSSTASAKSTASSASPFGMGGMGGFGATPIAHVEEAIDYASRTIYTLLAAGTDGCRRLGDWAFLESLWSSSAGIAASTSSAAAARKPHLPPQLAPSLPALSKALYRRAQAYLQLDALVRRHLSAAGSSSAASSADAHSVEAVRSIVGVPGDAAPAAGSVLVPAVACEAIRLLRTPSSETRAELVWLQLAAADLAAAGRCEAAVAALAKPAASAAAASGGDEIRRLLSDVEVELHARRVELRVAAPEPPAASRAADAPAAGASSVSAVAAEDPPSGFARLVAAAEAATTADWSATVSPDILRALGAAADATLVLLDARLAAVSGSADADVAAWDATTTELRTSGVLDAVLRATSAVLADATVALTQPSRAAVLKKLLAVLNRAASHPKNHAIINDSGIIAACCRLFAAPTSASIAAHVWDGIDAAGAFFSIVIRTESPGPAAYAAAKLRAASAAVRIAIDVGIVAHCMDVVISAVGAVAAVGSATSAAAAASAATTCTDLIRTVAAKWQQPSSGAVSGTDIPPEVAAARRAVSTALVVLSAPSGGRKALVVCIADAISTLTTMPEGAGGRGGNQHFTLLEALARCMASLAAVPDFRSSFAEEPVVAALLACISMGTAAPASESVAARMVLPQLRAVATNALAAAANASLNQPATSAALAVAGAQQRVLALLLGSLVAAGWVMSSSGSAAAPSSAEDDNIDLQTAHAAAVFLTRLPAQAAASSGASATATAAQTSTLQPSELGALLHASRFLVVDAAGKPSTPPAFAAVDGLIDAVARLIAASVTAAPSDAGAAVLAADGLQWLHGALQQALAGGAAGVSARVHRVGNIGKACIALTSATGASVAGAPAAPSVPAAMLAAGLVDALLAGLKRVMGISAPARSDAAAAAASARTNLASAIARLARDPACLERVRKLDGMPVLAAASAAADAVGKA